MSHKSTHHKPVSTETLLKQLQWRYATKKFNPTHKISAEDWSALEEALVLTPSSYGLQPWKFYVVTKAEVKEQLKPVSYGQAQVTDCSHYVVFAIKKSMSTADIDKYIARISEVRGVPGEKLAGYRGMMVKTLVEGPLRHEIDFWAKCQIYIALGNFMTAAALLGIDTCPMEGIDPDKYDHILGLGRHRLATVVACAAGYRAEDDSYSKQVKVRFKTEDVLERI